MFKRIKQWRIKRLKRKIEEVGQKIDSIIFTDTTGMSVKDEIILDSMYRSYKDEMYWHKIKLQELEGEEDE